MKVGSLFAGIGGIDVAFRNNGFEISWANEIDDNAILTYEKNHNTLLLHEDIKAVDVDILDDVDVITAGFPCQPVSVAGYRRGLQDSKWAYSIYKMFELVKAKAPEVLFLENVKNLQYHDNGKTLEAILKKIRFIGYHTKIKILNTCDYSNIPQNRERVYIVGFLNKEHYDIFKFPSRMPNNRKSIKDILETNVDKKYYCNKYKFYKILKQNITKEDTFYQWRRHYVRENKNKVCPTLTANMGTGGHNVPLIKDSKGIRKLTTRECARLQGFEDSFIFPENMANCHIYKQLGNSVSIPVVERIAKNIKQALTME